MGHPGGRHPLGHGPADHVTRGQLVDEPLTGGVAQQRPVAPQGLRQQRPGHGRVVEGRRVELEELDVGHGHGGPQGHGDTVAGGLHRVGGHGVELTGPAGGQHHVTGTHVAHVAVGVDGHARPRSARLR